MRGHEADGVGAGGAAGEGVGGDVLRLDLGEEVEGAPAAGAFLGAGGGGEEGADGVEVTVGVASGGAAPAGGPLQPLRPGGAVPQFPERLLGAAALGEERAGAAQQLAEEARAVGIPLVGDEPLRFGECAGEQGVGGRREGVSGGAFLVAQGTSEAALVGGVEGGEGRGEQREGGLGVEPGGGGVLGPGVGLGLGYGPRLLLGPVLEGGGRGGAQRGEQRGDGGLVAQREVVAVDVQRHPGRGESPADGGNGVAAGADQDRHLPQGTPSSRWARRRMSAMLSSSAPVVGYV